MGNKSKRKKQPTGNELKCITINTDASFHPEHLTSGYAYYIICDRFKIRSGGVFKNVKPKNAKEAEIMSIGNAIATLLAQKDLPTCDYMILNNDCKYGHNEIRLHRTELTKKVWDLWTELGNRLNANRRHIRHVRAHSGVNDARSYVNEWCDAEAKKWMRKETTEKIKKEKEAENENNT